MAKTDTMQDGLQRGRGCGIMAANTSGKGGRCMRGKTGRLAVSALLIAADVVLTRLLALNTSVMKIGLGFSAVALSALLYGPWWAALTAALGDLLGSLLFPTGAYFPGFTLTAACTGLIFGLCLYGKPARWVYPAAAALLNTLLISYLANTAMICLLSGSRFSAMLAARSVQLAVMLPVQLLVLGWLHRAPLVKRLIERS